jgi:hypothetical protein
MNIFPIDLISIILRSIQEYRFDEKMEGCSFLLKCEARESYWIIRQGFVQPEFFIRHPDVQISGSFIQWMELIYNPLSPINGCLIQGEPEVLQILKENLNAMIIFYNAYGNNYPLTRSIIQKINTLVHQALNRSPFQSPWIDYEEYEELGRSLKNLYHRFDHIQWALKERENKYHV